MYMYTYTRTQTHIHTYIYTHVYVYGVTYIQIHTHTGMQYFSTPLHIFFFLSSFLDASSYYSVFLRR